MIHLLCGVPGSGKTWVAKQLSGVKYLPHDDYPVADYHKHLISAAKNSSKIVAEAPFRISVLVDQLNNAGIEVKTYYISEPEHVIRKRYESRDKKPFPKQHSTNLSRYNQRDWDVKGTASEILNILKGV